MPSRDLLTLLWFAYPRPRTIGTRSIGRRWLPGPHGSHPHQLTGPKAFAALRFIAHSSLLRPPWPRGRKVHQWRKRSTHRPLYIRLCVGWKKWKLCNYFNGCGGRGGIRTHGTLAGTPVFKTGALNHSATLPSVEYQSLGPYSLREQTAKLAPGRHHGNSLPHG